MVLPAVGKEMSVLAAWLKVISVNSLICPKDMVSKLVSAAGSVSVGILTLSKDHFPTDTRLSGRERLVTSSKLGKA